jgi:ubiquinone biosynthesis protein COQ9
MLGFRLCWRTSSEIWYASGDRSTDWNYYSKRALLASVYSATIMFWLSDEPDDTGDYPETWMFLERRIQNILDTFRLPQYFKNFLNCNSQKTG